ncbi:YbhB/YbcL family Raf kinase inhibitor-like protein [Sphingomonas sp. G-3-2-10]|jgi:Raf kinase inhibitor-like YbhB/YbcL family protein|uniref:YbhB/YbcL family Raf kinase inhibitor-like protein n=1 Tax=Sphingomonas sp. G-3-2-10 TaxID=2728838 RepID=UPI00146F8628|nr:YbhB/YbcL family Raf kinase inhibitor-like protein [Sphingomonas sp. G-3-2-10]NML07197.1 YbhB/YbcL family Raf kinase inhibitor-like protein [Sphingomonas sp. G-3-2-10]
MLEHVPHWLGAALKGLRAGQHKLAIVQPELGSFESLHLASMAFGNGDRLPERFTADGEGVSPPLFWTQVPEGTERLVLIVEDPDAMTPAPTVHAVVWGLPIEGELKEGAIRADGDGGADGSDVGRHSFFGEGWLAPDPPTGHGVHHYAFQLFALGPGPDVSGTPGKNAILKAMAGRVIAAGLLTGTYSRGEEAPTGLVGAAVPA